VSKQWETLPPELHLIKDLKLRDLRAKVWAEAIIVNPSDFVNFDAFED
jgi:hypothetical protein